MIQLGAVGGVLAAVFLLGRCSGLNDAPTETKVVTVEVPTVRTVTERVEVPVNEPMPDICRQAIQSTQQLVDASSSLVEVFPLQDQMKAASIAIVQGDPVALNKVETAVAQLEVESADDRVAFWKQNEKIKTELALCEEELANQASN